MTLPVYPGRDLLPGLTYASAWSPVFYNLATATTVSGADIDVAAAQYPLHDFELTYRFLRDGIGRDAWLNGEGLEFRTMMGFLLQAQGTVGRFLYKNPDDHRVWRDRIATGDGSTTVFTLSRTFGANSYGASEPVGQVDTAAGVNVYLNGAATPVAPSLYTISTVNPVANTITFASAPADGHAIEIDMEYFYYCKLASNSNTVKKFMDRLWAMDKVSLHSCRPGA